MARFVTGRAGKPGCTVEGPSEVGSDFAARFPAITEYLTLDVSDGGGFRQRSTLQLVVEDGCWKGCLNDRHEQRSCWVTAATLEAVLVDLESILASGAVPWRHYQAWGAKKRKGS